MTNQGVLISTTTDFQEVNAGLCDQLQLLNAGIKLGLGLVIHRVELDTHTEILGHGFADSADDFNDDLDTAGRGSAVLVGPLVDLLGHELSEEIAMRAVDLNTGESGVGRQLGRLCEATHDILNIGNGHLTGGTKEERVDKAREDAVAEVQGHGAGGNGFLKEAAGAGAERRLTAGMVDLHDGRCAIAVADIGPGLPGLEHAVVGNGVIVRDVLW